MNRRNSRVDGVKFFSHHLLLCQNGWKQLILSQPPLFFGNLAYVYIGVVPTGGQTYTYIYIYRCDLTRCCWKKTKFNIISFLKCSELGLSTEDSWKCSDDFFLMVSLEWGQELCIANIVAS